MIKTTKVEIIAKDLRPVYENNIAHRVDSGSKMNGAESQIDS